MSNNKQSSVEWLVEQLFPNNDNIRFFCPTEILEQAKAMHKEEIERAFNEGENNSVDYFNPENRIKECEQYYNETFGGNDGK